MGVDRREVSRRIGTVFEGRWTLTDVLGVGAMGAVYASMDGNAPVAIKVLHASSLDNPRTVERLRREAELNARMDHPNVLRVYHYGDTATGEPYMVAERLEGMNLKAYTKSKGGQLSVDESLEMIRQLLEALSYCHGLGVLHRDIKPANIFVTQSGVLKLLDFGVALESDAEGARLTQDGSALGTPAFMPPEQARGRLDMLDERSDVFAAGATLYNMLSGQLLHKAGSAEESLVLAATTAPASVSRIMPELAPDVVNIVDTALAWNPSHRFQQADAMLVRVQSVLRKDHVRESLPKRSQSLRPLTTAQADQASAAGATEALQRAFDMWERTLKTAGELGWKSAQTDSRLQDAHEATCDAAKRAGRFAAIDVMPYAFAVGDTVVWEPAEPFDAVPYHLFDGGVRRMSIARDLPLPSLQALLRIVAMDPLTDVPREDDLGTTLWERRLKGLKFELFFDAGFTNPSDQERCAADRRIIEDRIAVLRADIGSDSSLGSGSFDRTPSKPTIASQKSRKRLATALEKQEDSWWLAKLPAVLAPAYQDALDHGDAPIVLEAFAEASIAWLERGRTRQLLTTYYSVCQLLGDRPSRRSFTEAVFDRTSVRALFQALDKWAAADAQDGRGRLEGGLLRCVHELLLNLPADRAMEVFDGLVAIQTHEPLAKLCSAYLGHAWVGFEDAIAHRIGELDLTTAKRLIDALVKDPTAQLWHSLRWVEENGDIELRMHILEARAEANAGDVASELAMLSKIGSPGVRMRALRLAAANKIEAITPALLERSDKPEFHALPVLEKRALLDALLKLAPIKGKRQIAELLSRKSGIGSDANSTRLVCVELLAPFAKESTVSAALGDATKVRPWNSKEVRAAADSALRGQR